MSLAMVSSRSSRLMTSSSLAKLLFQLGLLGIVKVFVFEDLVELLAQVFVLVQHFRHALLVEQRHGGAVIHRLAEVVFRDVIAEPLVGLAVAPKQRGAGEGEVLGIGQSGPHVLGQGLVLGAVGLVDDHDDVVAVGEQRIFLTLGPAEFLDQGKDEALVLAEECAHLLAVLRLGGIGLADGTGVEEIAVDLPVQVLAVGDDDEAVVALALAEDLAGVEDHRKALARALGVPEDAELAAEFLAAQELVEALVHADELVVLGDDLLGVLVVDDKVLDVVEQLVLRAEAGEESFDAGAVLADLLALDLLLLIVGPQPVEEMLPLGGQAADAGFDAVGEDAQGVGEEKLGDVRLVVGQVVVVGGAQFDVRVLQLDEDQRQAVDVEQNVRAAIARFGRRACALNPELGDGEELVVGRGRIVEIDDPDPLLAIAALFVLELDPHTVADESVHLTIGGDGGHGLALVAKLLERVVDGGFGNARIQGDGRFLQAVMEDDVALVRAPGAVIEVRRIGGVAVQCVVAKGAATAAPLPARCHPLK